MSNRATFGHADLAKKMAAQFGKAREPVKVEMRYADDVRKFIGKIASAHEKAAQSNLAFK